MFCGHAPGGVDSAALQSPLRAEKSLTRASPLGAGPEFVLLGRLEEEEKKIVLFLANNVSLTA